LTALVALAAVDVAFFVASARACDDVVGRDPLSVAVVAAYLLVALVCAARLYHYFSYYRSAKLMLGDISLPAPSSDVQALLAAAAYSACVAALALVARHRIGGVYVVVWAVAVVANVTYALATDDRPVLRALVLASERRVGGPHGRRR
jgi:hypothetical protein